MLAPFESHMADLRVTREAFGAPGIEPRWTHGGKDGVVTAYSLASRVWFTLWNGAVTEVYYPTVDRPQLRDLQLSFPMARRFSMRRSGCRRTRSRCRATPWPTARRPSNPTGGTAC